MWHFKSESRHLIQNKNKKKKHPLPLTRKIRFKLDYLCDRRVWNFSLFGRKDYKPSYFWNKKHIKKAAFTGIVILLKKKLGSAIQVIFLFAQLPLEWPTYLGVTYTSRTLIQKCYWSASCKRHCPSQHCTCFVMHPNLPLLLMTA